MYTDASLVLDASRRVAAVAGSGAIDMHLHCVVEDTDGLQVGSQPHAVLLDLASLTSITRRSV